MENITVNKEFITPGRAQELLSLQKGNRPISPRLVDYLSKEIVNGNWCLTHQGILLDPDGLLLDGQHRLSAIVKAQKGVWMFVTRGIPREIALKAVDQGRIRTRGQLFGMRGEKNSILKASICRSIGILLDPELQYSASLGPSEDIAILQEYRPSIETVIQSGMSGGTRMSSRFYAVVTLLHNANADLGLSFLSGVTTGADLAKGDARLTLRNWLLSSTANRMSSSADGAGIIVKTACAVSAYVDNQTINRLEATAAKFKRYCEIAGIPVNKSLYTYCGGNLNPNIKRSVKSRFTTKEKLSEEVEHIEPAGPDTDPDMSVNQLKFIRDWT